MRLIDALGLFYLALLLWIPFYWLAFHTALKLWRRIGSGAFWVALPIWLAWAVGIVVSRGWLLGWRLERSALTWCVGAGLFLAASWIDVQTRHAFGWRRLVGLTELNPRHALCGVVRSGIYARIRHPRYLLYMLMVLAMAFLTGAVRIFILALANCILLQIVAWMEERKLLQQYGRQYDDYRRSVPAFLPRLKST